MSWVRDRLYELRFEVRLWVWQQQIMWTLVKADSTRKHILGYILLCLIVNTTSIAVDVVAGIKTFWRNEGGLK